MEQTSIQRIQLLHPNIRESALQAYNEAVKITPKGVHPFVTQGLRTFEEQGALYAQGRTKPGEIVTNAPPGSSFHQYGLALDFCLLINDKESWKVDSNWIAVANVFKKYGFEWGGEWKSLKDYPHVQKGFGYTWRQLLDKYNKRDFIPGTQYVNL
jgi:peptidoglycan L-alanyl-D-glutamate endopeptidase CwlK